MTNYVIDLVGTCNLKCPSYGRRERYAYTRPTKADGFQPVLQGSWTRLGKKVPMSNNIVLYNWGEPLMQQIDEDRIVSYAAGSVRARRPLRKPGDPDCSGAQLPVPTLRFSVRLG